MEYRVFIFARVDRINSRYATLDANTSRGIYIDPLSPPWRRTAVDVVDCNRRATVVPVPFPRPALRH